jgi:hypothetical protein
MEKNVNPLNRFWRWLRRADVVQRKEDEIRWASGRISDLNNQFCDMRAQRDIARLELDMARRPKTTIPYDDEAGSVDHARYLQAWQNLELDPDAAVIVAHYRRSLWLVAAEQCPIQDLTERQALNWLIRHDTKLEILQTLLMEATNRYLPPDDEVAGPANTPEESWTHNKS